MWIDIMYDVLVQVAASVGVNTVAVISHMESPLGRWDTVQYLNVYSNTEKALHQSNRNHIHPHPCPRHTCRWCR